MLRALVSGERPVNVLEILSGCSCQRCSGVKCAALPGGDMRSMALFALTADSEST